MTTSIYEVLDTAVDGLRLQIEFQPRANFSLASSGIPFIRAVVVHNETGGELATIALKATLSLVGGGSQSWTTELAGPISANAVTRLDDENQFAVFLPLLAHTNEATPGTLELRATAGTAVASLVAAVEISAANEWLNSPGLHAALAAFVQPNTRTVTGILRTASDLLLKRTSSGSLDGYQSGSARAHQIAGALYEAIRGLEVTYINPPASFEHTGQKVRTTEQVLRDRFGTCIDLAVLYAACLEAVGLFPVLFITRNHAFAGFYSAEAYGAAATVTEVNALTNMVETGLVHPVELTGVGPGSASLNFRDATKAAQAYFRVNFHYLQTMVDVSRARLDGIRPMPQLGTDDVVGAEQTQLERPFVAKSSLKNLELATEEEVVRGVLESTDDSPARFRNWKRDLLDLTLRNPLLNMPRTQKVLDLLVPGGMLPLLDDVVHSGKSVKLAGGVDSSELQKLAGIRVASEVAPESMIALFQQSRRVYSGLDDEKHRRQLRAMKREADTLEQESGSNYLYLTLGTLVHSRADGSEARAPLFLLPVRLTGGLAFSPYALTLDGEELAQPNLCLLQWLKTTKGVDLTALSSPALDESGLAIGTTLAGIRTQLLDAELPYRIDESASLAILRFSTFQIWKDLDTNWRSLLANPVVQHLVETPGETFTDPAGSGDLMIDETSLRLPIAADGSQMAAIVRATSGQSFVLEGPPGTGKSQTITNLIAHALTAGKKVLFVAEKQAALEVVKRRLDAIGLGSFGLELHGAKQSMNSIRDQLRAALDLRVASDTATWEVTDARLRAAIVELTQYPDTVHTANAQGHTLWSAYDATGTLGSGPAAIIPLPWLTEPSALDTSSITRDFADAASRFGLRPGHRWILSGVADPARLAVDELRTALGALTAARGRLGHLSAPVRAALPQLTPAHVLPAFLRLLRARDQALLPAAGQLVYIDRPSWKEAADALRRDLVAFRAAHERVLHDVTPEGWELTDLGALIAESEKLDASWFFPGLRRGSLRKRITAILRDSVVVDDAGHTGVLIALRTATTGAEPLRAALTALHGAILPASWRPYTDGALDELDEALWTARSSVWMASVAPTAWALLSGTPGGTSGIAAADTLVLADISEAWLLWLGALAATPATVRQWSASGVGEGETPDWTEAWARDEALWATDLDTTGVLQLQRFAETRKQLDDLARGGLFAFSDQLATVEIAPSEAQEALLRGTARASLRERSAVSNLDAFDGDSHDRAASAYLTQGIALREQLRTAVAARLIAQRPFDASNLRGEVAELARQIERKRGGLAFREVANRYPRALTAITPCFLMSPGSVAHFLDADSIEFDLVIFDEASQIRVPQAIGAMGRGKSVIVVGDSRQMPPTRLMQVDAAPEAAASDGDLVVEDLESILTEAVESGLPQLWLNWHYRSQDESLIAFSNTTYYSDKLVSLPSPRSTSDTGLSWRRVDGVFDRGRSRTNEVEADAIVDEIRARLADPATAEDSLGVVCFNIQQRDLILNKLEDSADLLVQQALTREPGQALFVKNLENVQGDERDTILFSLAFSLDAETGRLPLNFGPLGATGGERRLNVAVTRARKQIVLFSSFDPEDIDLSRTSSQGITDLRRYLEFAASRTLTRGTAQSAMLGNRGRMVTELSNALAAEGFEVETELGMSSFRVDLAVRRPGDPGWLMAVMVDGPGWASRPTVSDRDGSPQLLVDLMGWPLLSRIWLPGWMRDRDGVLAALLEKLRAEPSAGSQAAADEERATAVPVAPAVAQAAEAAAARVDVPLAAAAPSAVAGAAAATSTISLPLFEAAPDSAIASQSVLNNMDMARPAIRRIAHEALVCEGPVPLERLVATVSRRFGYTRLGETKRAELTDSIAAQFDVVDGFVWPIGVDPETWRGARKSPSTTVRALSEVSLQEIANVMELVLRESFSITRDDLLKESAEVLGYGRLSEQGRTWLGTALDRAIARKRIVTDGERLTLQT
jgi:hypothetical protein